MQILTALKVLFGELGIGLDCIRLIGLKARQIYVVKQFRYSLIFALESSLRTRHLILTNEVMLSVTGS